MLPEISPGSYKKMNSYNSTKGNVNNTKSCLRDLHIESPERGQIGGPGQKRRGKWRDTGHDLQEAGLS